MFTKKHSLSILLILVVIFFSILPLRAELTEVEIEILKPKERVVPVTLVIDESFRAEHRQCWKYAAKVTNKSFGELEKYFNIKFKIEYFTGVDFPTTSSIHADVILLKLAVEPPKDGIIIWLSSRRYADCKIAEGAVDRTHRYAAVTDYGKSIITSTVLSKMLVHELLHLFGARDVANPDSIMCLYTDILLLATAKIDSDTAAIVLRNKWKKFDEQPEKR